MDLCEVMAELRARLPPGWLVVMHTLNAHDYWLPHDRARVFIRGTSPAMRATGQQRKFLAMDYNFFASARQDLQEFLDATQSPQDFQTLGDKAQENVLLQVATHCESGAVHVGIVDPQKRVDSDIRVNSCKTLRCNNKHLWILPANDAQKQIFGPHGRLLSYAEKARLMGITLFSLAGMRPASLEKALGNGIPVPLAGVVLVPLLAAWRLMKRREQLAKGLEHDQGEVSPGALTRVSSGFFPASASSSGPP